MFVACKCLKDDHKGGIKPTITLRLYISNISYSTATWILKHFNFLYVLTFKVEGYETERHRSCNDCVKNIFSSTFSKSISSYRKYTWE